MPQVTLSTYRAALFVVAAMLAACTGPGGAPIAGPSLPNNRLNRQSSSTPNDSSRQALHVTKLLKALQPFGIAVNSSGDVYFTELPSSSAKVFLTDGKIESIAAQLRQAHGIAVYKNVTYIADTTHRLVKRVSGNGKVSTIGSGWDYPDSVTTDSDGDLYVYDNGLRNIFHFRHDQQLGSRPL
jgi:DNA-binding beta-propeller fold protein YncE